MQRRLRFATSSHEATPASVARVDVLLTGNAIDERGHAAQTLLRQQASEAKRLEFDISAQALSVDGTRTSVARLASELRGSSIRLETTTMGLAEIIRSVQTVIEAKIDEIEFVYVEPRSYNQSVAPGIDVLNPREFRLSKNAAFHSLQGFAQEFSDERDADHVFFLGFEDARLRQALEQRGELPQQTYRRYAVIGVPAFDPGWETNVLAAHAELFLRFGLTGQYVKYCAANSVSSAYRLLWDLYEEVADESKIFWISPLGTKPHSIASALFLLETKREPRSTALFYDHPERAADRSQHVARWHFVRVSGLAEI